MSYGHLHHDNQSSYASTQQAHDHSSPLAKVATYESEDNESALEDLDKIGAQEGYELEDLNPGNGPNDQPKADLDVEDSDSEDGDKLQFRRAHRDSASTTQSFMLYTPHEERTVRRKFDRRLVLFVAFLYMLSFLDRSSTLPTLAVLVWFASFRQLERGLSTVSQPCLGSFAPFPLACG